MTNELRTQPVPCPNCGKTIDALSPIDGKDVFPEPGDTSIAICSSCGAIMALDKDMHLRELTADEQDFFERDPMISAARRIVRH
jgi:predicted RNA-binding Zn-ribbon protein involved in translation (DUF1610 family)